MPLQPRPSDFAALALLVLIGLPIAGCGPRENSAQPPGSETAAENAGTPAPAREPPGWDEAANASYTGLDQPVTLSGGRWEGAPYIEGGASAPSAGIAEGFLVSGDLDADGDEESVVLLWTSGGGSGTFDYLAVLERKPDGGVTNRGTAPLGDRVKIRSAAVTQGQLVVETVEAGPGDAACCPGQKLRRSFVLQGDALRETATQDQGRQTIADIAGNWRLTHFGPGEPVPDGVVVTLDIDGAAISGRSACNNYRGSVVEGATPGEISLAGPLIGTRMACPEPQNTAEARYTTALANLRQYSFHLGRLALSCLDGHAPIVLIFERAPTAASPQPEA